MDLCPFQGVILYSKAQCSCLPVLWIHFDPAWGKSAYWKWMNIRNIVDYVTERTSCQFFCSLLQNGLCFWLQLVHMHKFILILWSCCGRRRFYFILFLGLHSTSCLTYCTWSNLTSCNAFLQETVLNSVSFTPVTQANYVCWLNEHSHKKRLSFQPKETTKMSPGSNLQQVSNV